jgi:hypothetical protein
MKLTNLPSIPEECTRAMETYQEYKQLKRILGKLSIILWTRKRS